MEASPKTKPLTETRSRVLWYSGSKRKARTYGDEYLVDLFVSSDHITDALASDYYSIVVVEYSANEEECLDILKAAKKSSPQTTRLQSTRRQR